MFPYENIYDEVNGAPKGASWHLVEEVVLIEFAMRIGVRTHNPEEDALSSTTSHWLLSGQSNDVFTFGTFQYFLTCVLPDSKPCGGGGGLKSQGPLTAWELTGINFRCNRSVFQKIKKQLLREVVGGGIHDVVVVVGGTH